MTKETQQQIKKWLKDFEKTQPHNIMVDYETFEGSAYALLGKALIEHKQTQKEVIDFFKQIIKGIRGEYEQGWSHRDNEQDIKTLKDIFN